MLLVVASCWGYAGVAEFEFEFESGVGEARLGTGVRVRVAKVSKEMGWGSSGRRGPGLGESGGSCRPEGKPIALLSVLVCKKQELTLY